MSWVYWLSGAAALLIFAYLVVALVQAGVLRMSAAAEAKPGQARIARRRAVERDRRVGSGTAELSMEVEV